MYPPQPACFVNVIQGEIGGSLADFNKLYEQNPSMRSYLWQRGLSLYYLGQFEDGAKQFREDVAVNPNDSEEVSQYPY